MKEEWYDKTEQYLRGELPDAQQQAFEEELSADPELRAFFETQKNIIGGVIYAREKKLPGDYLIEERVRKVGQAVRRRERQRFMIKIGAAALGLGLALGLVAGYFFFGENEPEVVAASRSNVIIKKISVRVVPPAGAPGQSDSIQLKIKEFELEEPRYWRHAGTIELFTNAPFILGAVDFELILSEQYGPVLRIEGRYYEAPYTEQDEPLRQLQDAGAIRELQPAG